MALNILEEKSIYLVRESYNRFKNLALLWSMGKDSTALLWICRKAFYGKIPFPVLHIDTSYKFKEIYAFREHWSKQWNINLLVAQNKAALSAGMNHRRGRFECCSALKTQTLQEAVRHHNLQGLLLAIRRDEHGIRAKERVFSPRYGHAQWDYQNQPVELWDMPPSDIPTGDHLRIHPMLDWTELDVWQYVQQEKIPIVDLYLARNGRRYRSIGCEPCCAPVPSKAGSIRQIIAELKATAVSERSGRAQDKEDINAMQKLRSLGYM